MDLMLSVASTSLGAMLGHTKKKTAAKYRAGQANVLIEYFQEQHPSQPVKSGANKHGRKG